MAVRWKSSGSSELGLNDHPPVPQGSAGAPVLETGASPPITAGASTAGPLPPETAKVRSCQRSMEALIQDFAELERRLITAKVGIQQSLVKSGTAVTIDRVDELCLRNAARELQSRASAVVALAIELAAAEPRPAAASAAAGPPVSAAGLRAGHDADRCMPPGGSGSGSDGCNGSPALSGAASAMIPPPVPPSSDAPGLRPPAPPQQNMGAGIASAQPAADPVVVRAERKFGRPRIP